MSEPRKKPKRSLLHYAPYLMGVFVAVLLVHDIFGTHGYLAMRQKRGIAAGHAGFEERSGDDSEDRARRVWPGAAE